MNEADLRRILSRPASLGDLLEAWMITHPRKAAGRQGAESEAALRRDMRHAGATESGLEFWFDG